jgi:hypothetical protein
VAKSQEYVLDSAGAVEQLRYTTRRRVLVSELQSAARGEAALKRVLDLFGRYRMLTFDRDLLACEPTVEVAHEALLDSWARLGTWIAESPERLLIQRRMMLSAAEWHQSARETSFLARGARLAQFAELAEQGDEAGVVRLTATEQAYLTASIEEQQRAAAAEREQQVRELSLQKHAARRLRALVIGLTLFLIIAAGLATWAFNRSQVAQNNFAHADALRLASDANSLISSHGPGELAATMGRPAVLYLSTSHKRAKSTGRRVMCC